MIECVSLAQEARFNPAPIARHRSVVIVYPCDKTCTRVRWYGGDDELRTGVLVQSGTIQIATQISAFVVVEAYMMEERSWIVRSVTIAMARIEKSIA